MAMRILVVGAGRSGAQVLRQLQTNPDLDVVTADPNEEPYAVAEGVIDSVDVREQLTPLNLAYIVEQVQPDMILLAQTSQDLSLGQALGMGLFTDSLRAELSLMSEVPVIEVAT
jgi:FlaA1/EpsC-like NDP-sugar epimerase